MACSDVTRPVREIGSDAQAAGVAAVGGGRRLLVQGLQHGRRPRLSGLLGLLLTLGALAGTVLPALASTAPATTGQELSKQTEPAPTHTACPSPSTVADTATPSPSSTRDADRTLPSPSPSSSASPAATPSPPATASPSACSGPPAAPSGPAGATAPAVGGGSAAAGSTPRPAMAAVRAPGAAATPTAKAATPAYGHAAANVLATGPSLLPISRALLDRLLASLHESPVASARLAVAALPLDAQRPNLRHFQSQPAEPREGGARSVRQQRDSPALLARSATTAVPSRLGAGLGAAMLMVVGGLFGGLSAARRPLRRLSKAARRRMTRGLERTPAPSAGAPHVLRPALIAMIGLTLVPVLAASTDLGTHATTTAQIRAHMAAQAHTVVFARRPPSEVRPAAAASLAIDPIWTQLVSIEGQVLADEVQLATEGQALKSLALQATGLAPEDDTTRPGLVPARPFLRERTVLGALQQATQQRYASTITAEYNLFRSVAPAAAKRANLLAAAARHASPEVQAAVSYNLAAVQTQMSQEAAISTAEALLQAPDGWDSHRRSDRSNPQPLSLPEFGVITQGFGPTDFSLEPPLTYDGVTSPHFHTGLDIAAPANTPVRAVADGVVVLAAASVDASGQLVGYGNHVVIAHADGLITLYAHLNSIAVNAGDIVRQGQVIGLEGSTGWSTGPHLHFEIRLNGEFLDPRSFFGNLLPT